MRHESCPRLFHLLLLDNPKKRTNRLSHLGLANKTRTPPPTSLPWRGEILQRAGHWLLPMYPAWRGWRERSDHTMLYLLEHERLLAALWGRRGFAFTRHIHVPMSILDSGKLEEGDDSSLLPYLLPALSSFSLRLLGSGLFQYQENKQYHGFGAAMFTSSSSHIIAVLCALSLAVLTQGKGFPFPAPTPADQQPPELVAWSPKTTEAPRIRGRVPLPTVFARQAPLPPSVCGYVNADKSASPLRISLRIVV